MKIVKNIKVSELKRMASALFSNFVKAVIDVDKEILVVDAELHADQEAYLLELGSKQESLWGINIYPDLNIEERIEFNSMINLRPSQKNNSMSIEDENIRNKIINIVNSKIINDVDHTT